MQIKPIHIQKYIALCKSERGIDVTESDAQEQLRKLLILAEITSRPVTRAEFEMVQNRRKELGLPELKMEGNEDG